MEELNNKLGYLKGLLDGMDVEPSTKEGKVYWAIVNILEEMSLLVAETTDRADYLEDYVYEVDSSLCDLEMEVYDDSLDFDEFDDDFVEVECGGCGQVTYVDIENDDLVFDCPSCGDMINAVAVIDEIYGIDEDDAE